MDSTNRRAVPSGFCKRLRRSGGAGGWGDPAEEEEVPSAEFAAVGEQDPAEGFLHGVADADASEFNRTAMRAMGGAHTLQ